MKHFDLGHMGLHKRKENDVSDMQVNQEEEELDASEFEEEDVLPVKVKNRRPKEDNFTQQRLKAWNPVFTPRIVIPIYLIITMVFVIVGGCLLAEANQVNELTIWYQDCSKIAPTNSWGDMPDGAWSNHYFQHRDYSKAPQWRYTNDTNDDSDEKGTCHIRFTTPVAFKKTVYVNYLLKGFSANHRRYVLSYSEDQLRGKAASRSDIHDGAGINCKQLSEIDGIPGKVVYPCGLIANSFFNDTFPFELINVNDSTRNYRLTNKGINWKSDKSRYKNTNYRAENITPPPYWIKRYPQGYNESNIPHIHDDEEFQNWMRPAAFNKFAKLIRKNSDDTLLSGEYQIDIGLHWPVRQFNGKKGVYITHGSSVGSRNFFLGVVYLIGGCLCGAMAILLFGFWMISGRREADPSYLSWSSRSVSM